jgi:hypothetical protein
VALEHDADWAASVNARLDAAGLGQRVDVVVAPLRRQRFGATEVSWYDSETVAGRIAEPIDVLFVDGPPAAGSWGRWPALEVLHTRLAPAATVFLDDGRRRAERVTAFRWARDHPDLDLFWIDTVKGTWLLRRRTGSGPGRTGRAALAARRMLHPRPPGYGLGSIRR